MVSVDTIILTFNYNPHISSIIIVTCDLKEIFNTMHNSYDPIVLLFSLSKVNCLKTYIKELIMCKML